jgi:hypothetical protein
MPPSRIVHRYSAYFKGWATAFGSHDKRIDETRGLFWLFGEGQIGLVLTPEVKRFLYPLFLRGRGDSPPDVALTRDSLRIDQMVFALGQDDERALDVTMGLLSGGGDLHLFQTYHLFYPSGTRILTLSCHPPLPLVYREIAPLTVLLGKR